MRSGIVACGVVGLIVAACGGDDSSGSSSGGGSSSSSGGSTYSTALQKGIATFYDADGSGNCSFDKSPDAMNVVALNMPEYAGSAMCGACLEVKGPKGSVTVRVTDSCPPCEKNHIDLSKEAFVQIADEVQGRVDITYRTVACDVSGPIAYHFKDGVSKYWVAIQLRNHRVPVAKLEYQKAGAWVEMKRADYNFFLEESGVGDTPGGLHVRVTSADGRRLEDTLPSIEAEKTFQGTANF